MGTGGEAGPVVGSVTADVIYNAKVPVLVVPEESPEMELQDFKRVVYATNFDEKDFSVFDKLIGILEPFNVKVYCVHVGKEPSSDWDKARLEGMKNVLKNKFSTTEFDCRLLVGDDLPETIDKFIR